jgi:hypothetical protein
VIHKLKRQLSLLNFDGEDWSVVLVLCLSGCAAGQVRRTCFLLISGCPLCLCRESLERVEAASAGFRVLSFPFCGSCPPLVLACKLVSPVQTYFSFSNKAGSYGLLSKKTLWKKARLPLLQRRMRKLIDIYIYLFIMGVFDKTLELNSSNSSQFLVKPLNSKTS